MRCDGKGCIQRNSCFRYTSEIKANEKIYTEPPYVMHDNVQICDKFIHDEKEKKTIRK